MIDELQLADSLLAMAMAMSPKSALPPYERASGCGGRVQAARRAPDVPRFQLAALGADALLRGLPFANTVVTRAPNSGDAWFMRSRIYTMLYVATQNPVWRDSALRDLKKASVISGARADIWSRRASTEVQAGLFRDALFSVEQGAATDYLHTNAAHYCSRASAELGLQQFEKAGELSSRRWGFGAPGSRRASGGACASIERPRVPPPRALRTPLTKDTGLLPSITVVELRLFAVAIQARAGMTDSAERAYQSVVAGWTDAVDRCSFSMQSMPGAGRPRQRARPRGAGGAGFGCFQRHLPWYQPRRHPLFAAAMGGIAPAGLADASHYTGERRDDGLVVLHVGMQQQLDRPEYPIALANQDVRRLSTIFFTSSRNTAGSSGSAVVASVRVGVGSRKAVPALDDG
jgi:hypothetical protein